MVTLFDTHHDNFRHRFSAVSQTDDLLACETMVRIDNRARQVA